MTVRWAERKREKVLAERRIDFADLEDCIEINAAGKENL